MRKVLSIILTIALVLMLCIVPTVSNADPGAAELKLDILSISGPTMEHAIEASKAIKLVQGEMYQLQFKLTMIPPAESEVRVRFPQSTIVLSVNGNVDPSFRHRELYKYETSKGNGEFLVVVGTAEFVADDTGKVELAVKGNNVAGATPVESKASAIYQYTPATYADIIQHKMSGSRLYPNPKLEYYQTKKEYTHGSEVYTTDIIENGSEIWDIGSGITFSRMLPAGTKVVFEGVDDDEEPAVLRAYCEPTIPGTFRTIVFKYPDGSSENYLSDAGDGKVDTTRVLVRCDDKPSNPKAPADWRQSGHIIYYVDNAIQARTFFNQDEKVIQKRLLAMGMHGEACSDYLFIRELPDLPDGTIWTADGVTEFDQGSNEPIYNRMLLYPLKRNDITAPAPYFVVTYRFGDADFYWAHEDLYGGMRSDTDIVAPPAPIPNGTAKFLHWIDENGAVVDFTNPIPVTKDAVYTAVYEGEPTPPPSTPATTTESTTTESTTSIVVTTTVDDGGVDYFPPITTTTKNVETTSEATSNEEDTTLVSTTSSEVILTSFATTGPTPGPMPTSSNAVQDLEEEEVALGGLTTTSATATETTTAVSTTVTTTGSDGSGLQGTGDANLPVTGFTANEVFWIGGGMIAFLGTILLVLNRKNGSSLN